MLNIPVVATGLLTVAVCGLAAGFVSGRADAHSRYLVSIERAEQGAYAARKLCMPLVGADWERCTAKALADQWRAVADADAAHSEHAGVVSSAAFCRCRHGLPAANAAVQRPSRTDSSNL